jgi:hypothetical protein
VNINKFVNLVQNQNQLGPVVAKFAPNVSDPSQNYPYPFNPATEIRYPLPEASDVHLVIYNIIGQKVRTLIYSPHDVGYYNVRWDGRNDRGNNASMGFTYIGSKQALSYK